MIELDQKDTYYEKEFGRFKSPPTHAHLVMMKWALPPETLVHEEAGARVMLRPHIEAVYIYGRRDEAGVFYQTEDDGRLRVAHAGVDMTDYDVSDNWKDGAVRLEVKEQWKKAKALVATLLAEGESPHVDDPLQRIPAPSKRANRFSEFDLDIVFSHSDYRLRGRAVE